MGVLVSHQSVSSKPIYRQIADDIRNKIQKGEWKAGDALPTEARLREMYSVSRVTVRQAIRLLVEQQILESIQGSGTYVKEAKVNYDIYQLTSFDEKLINHNIHTHSDVLTFTVMTPPPIVAEELSLNEGERVWYVKRLRYLGDKAVTLEETWMPLSLFPDLTFQVMEGSKYVWIERVKQLSIERSEQEIIPRMPSKEMAQLLGLAADKPILEKVSKGYLSDGRLFEYSRNYFSTDDYKFTLVARRHPASA